MKTYSQWKNTVVSLQINRIEGSKSQQKQQFFACETIIFWKNEPLVYTSDSVISNIWTDVAWHFEEVWVMFVALHFYAVKYLLYWLCRQATDNMHPLLHVMRCTH